MRNRHLLFGFAIAAVSLVPSLALANDAGSVFGNLSTANTMGQGKGTIGISAGIADANSVAGWFAFGMSRYIDGRVKLGLYDAGADTRFALGGDFKWQFWSVSEGHRYPFDMALGGLLEYDGFNGGSFFQIGSHLTGSYPFRMSNGSTLSPYGRVNVRLATMSVNNGGSNSDINFGLNGGVAWDVTKVMRFYGEFQLDGNDGVFFGVEFNVM